MSLYESNYSYVIYEETTYTFILIELLTAVLLKIQSFSHITPCRIVSNYRSFEGETLLNVDDYHLTLPNISHDFHLQYSHIVNKQ